MSDTAMMPPIQGIRDRWYDFRDRLMRRPEFLRWATRFPLTRPIARRRARQLFDIVSGFVYSQVLYACVRLKLFDLLADGPRSIEDLASRLGLGVDATHRLLTAAVSLRLVSVRGGNRYGLGELGGALLANPGVVAMIEHHAILYDDLRDPIRLLRDPDAETGLARYWAYAEAEDPAALTTDSVTDYSALMAASQAFIAAEILDAYSLRRHRCLLDVGGGEGAFITAAAAAAPHLSFILFDLPAVAGRARHKLAAGGLEHRVHAVGGDFFADPLPTGADIISLVRVIHDHDDDRARALLKAAKAALPEDGTLLLAEPMAGTPGAEPAGAAYFGFYLMAMRSGRPRTEGELRSMLMDAGFGEIRSVPTSSPMLTRLLIATA